jgi:hypothetical protein
LSRWCFRLVSKLKLMSARKYEHIDAKTFTHTHQQTPTCTHTLTHTVIHVHPSLTHTHTHTPYMHWFFHILWNSKPTAWRKNLNSIFVAIFLHLFLLLQTTHSKRWLFKNNPFLTKHLKWYLSVNYVRSFS